MLNIEKPEQIIFTVEKPISYWCNVLDCEKEDLLDAIRAIGSSFSAVDSLLILNRKKKTRNKEQM